MSFTIESLTVAVLALLPGFFAHSIGTAIKNDAQRPIAEMIADAILTSVILNVIALIIYILIVRGIDLSSPLKDIQTQMTALTGWSALLYLGVLYALALFSGILGGVTSDRFAIGGLAYRLRLTPISPATNVLTDVLQGLVGTSGNRKLAGKPEQQVAWLRLRRDGKIIEGRIRKTSVRFAVNEPIEVFLNPVHVRENEVLIERPASNVPAEPVRGIYLRLRPEDVTEILVRRTDWDPRAPTQTAAPPAPVPQAPPARLPGPKSA